MALNSDKGQTLVEYVLLLAVAVSIVVTFYNSAFFQSLFGIDGTVAKSVKSASEWGYRHAFYHPRDLATPSVHSSADAHPSYYNQPKSKSRFFGPNDPYP